MLLYNNRSLLRLVCSFEGSIFWKPQTFGIALFCALLAVGLQLLQKAGVGVALELQAEHHYGIHAIGGVVGFAVVFRTNLGWQRYWEAVSQLHFMYSKWGDAYSQLFAFASVSIQRSAAAGDHLKSERIQFLLNKLMQNFILLSAIAADRLTHGDTQRMERRTKVAKWSDQLVTREALRLTDLTGAWNLPEFEAQQEAQNSPVSRPSKAHSAGSAERPPHHVPETRANRLMGSRTIQALERIANIQRSTNEWLGTKYLVKVEPVAEELAVLRTATDRVTVVMYWIIHDLAAISADLHTAPPIQSRMYQELSNGMLAFNQAMKLADVPFPFPYAQLLTLLLVVFLICIPVYMVSFTDSQVVAAILSFALSVGMWGLNDTAIELENPFGPDANDIFLEDFHLRFIDLCHEVRVAHSVMADPARRGAPTPKQRDASSRSLVESEGSPVSQRVSVTEGDMFNGSSPVAEAEAEAPPPEETVEAKGRQSSPKLSFGEAETVEVRPRSMTP